MANPEFKPYVPATTTMPELTIKALLLGVVMAIVLGAANAYPQDQDLTQTDDPARAAGGIRSGDAPNPAWPGQCAPT